jgi:SAM-dependent MidA family methyltransferase
MTPLAGRLKRLIEAAGPISIADYMAACLSDPDHGYYTTSEPFGTSGDFTTAPEISQMFGELMAATLYQAWLAAGKPVPVTLAEIGPGRATLMADMLRTLDRIDPAFVDHASVALVETSPRLTAIQKQRLATTGRARSRWYTDLSQVPAGALLLVANELFDAIPTRQFVKVATGWRERMVALDTAGDLAFAVGMTGIDHALLPEGADAAPQGAVAEISPAREAMMQAICERIVRDGGVAVLVDYGYTVPPFGDTLQALRRHAFDDVLAHPGEADLTTHVDFAALARVATATGLEATIDTQGNFLLAAGLLERAGALGAGRDAATQQRLRGEVERLAGPDVMGDLFKVLTVRPHS